MTRLHVKAAGPHRVVVELFSMGVIRGYERNSFSIVQWKNLRLKYGVAFHDPAGT